MTKDKLDAFKDFCIERHDVFANQKYGDTLPYSFHLDMVARQASKWSYLLDNQNDKYITLCGVWGHDLIEDARVTWNDIVKIAGEDVANVIYACTDEKGKNRNERHSKKYYIDLFKIKLAVYVKLCDIIANITYSLLTTSSMYKKYSKEYPTVKKYLYRPEYNDMFIHIEKLIQL